MQPGDVVGPGNEQPKNEPELAEKPVTESIEAPIPELPQTPTPQPQEENPDSNWQYTEDANSGNSSSMQTPHETVTWTASEYIAHEKTAGWYLLLAVVVVGAAGVVYLLTKEIVSTVVIVIMGAAFASFANRKPQELTYTLDSNGLKIGDKAFNYSQFKSFTIIEEGAIDSIMIMPLQRFMPPLSIYFDPSDEEKITDALSGYLPYEDRKQDPVDRLMRKVRF